MPPTEIDEKTFESSFAEMALTSLKNAAPALIDYMMGFQLVDRSDDDTHACGFFGFKIGKAWAYVPVFFLSGEVKGTELLYIKDQDIILPLEEGWVDYLIQRKPFVLGKAAPKDRSKSNISGPDLRRLRVPPSDSKIAADQSAGFHVYGLDSVADWAADGMRMFVEKNAQAITPLPEYLAERGLTDSYIRLMRQNPKVASATLPFYTLADLQDAQVKVAQHRKQAATGGYESMPSPISDDEKKDRELRIIDRDTASRDFSELAFLSDEEKKRLMTGNVLIDDRRTNDGVRRTYGIELTKELFNPGEPGLYDVLNITGEFSKMLVLQPAMIGGGGSRDLRILLDPSTLEYQLQWKTQIWAAKHYPRKDLEEQLADVGSDLSTKPQTGDRWDGQRYLIIDSLGNKALGPFTVKKTVQREDTTTQLFVEPISPRVESYSYTATSNNGNTPRKLPFEGPMFSEDGEIDLNQGGSQNSYNFKEGLLQILISDKKLSKIVHGDRATMVPRDAGFRLVKLGEPLSSVRCTGSLADLHLRIGKFAEAIKIYNDGTRLNITGDDFEVTVPASNQKLAFEALMRDLSLDEQSARQVYKTACECLHKAHRYYAPRLQEKTAAPFDKVMIANGSDPWLGVPVADSNQQRLIEQLPEYQTVNSADRGAYRHQPGENDAFSKYYKSDMQEMEQAAQTGQKDVFDSAAIGSLINVDDVSAEIDSYTPKLISAVDKLGRILFMVYWHAEEVRERYGKQEVKNLEDNVKAVFQKLGDTVLELKKQSPADEDYLGRGIE